MSPSYCYLIAIKDNASDNYSYGIPDEVDAPQVVFTSLEEAKTAVQVVASKFESFIPVAYGVAFPYDSFTFEQLLQKEGFAPYGWGVIETEEESYRLCVGLVRMSLQ
jgi:hypothetical protein